jgi:RNA polymerase sporulation-specific sigma factor
MRDEDVIFHVRAGHAGAVEHLLTKYRFLVEGKARTYYLVGAEHEDVVQEGMIGLFKAIRDFSELGRAAFRSFAELCITRQIITAVKTSTRHKHRLFNQCVSLDAPPGGEDYCDLEERLVDSRDLDPEQVALARDYCQCIIGQVQAVLSDFETQTLACYLQGMSYRAVGEQLGCQVKQVDNALQRAKKKLSDTLQGASVTPEH